MGTSNSYQSLGRGLKIIEALADLGGAGTLAEITRKTGLARSTAHHLFQALVEFGYLIQENGNRTYALSPKLFQLTRRPWTNDQLVEISKPFLDELTRRSGEGASLAVLRDGVVRVIAKRETEGPVRVVQEIGAVRPIYCTAVGKSLAAWLPEEELNGIINRTHFEAKTSRTITSKEAFLLELARVRERGYAFDDEEHYPGIRCLATHVRDHLGEVCAALCVTGPKSHLPKRRLGELRQILGAVCADLSARLGYEAAEWKHRPGEKIRKGG